MKMEIILQTTRISTTAEGPHYMLHHLKSYHMPHSCTQNHIWKSLQ